MGQYVVVSILLLYMLYIDRQSLTLQVRVIIPYLVTVGGLVVVVGVHWATNSVAINRHDGAILVTTWTVLQ